jgi:hypothetical protein
VNPISSIFRGGRKGALSMIIASLLYYAPKPIFLSTSAMNFLQEYIKKVKQLITIDEKNFTDYYLGLRY